MADTSPFDDNPDAPPTRQAPACPECGSLNTGVDYGCLDLPDLPFAVQDLGLTPFCCDSCGRLWCGDWLSEE